MERIHPKHIGFDFDGVIADIAEAFIRLAYEDYGYVFKVEEITHFNVEQCLAIDPEIVDEVFTRILYDSVKTGLRPMPGALDVLSELADTATITIITARHDPEPVNNWLECMTTDAVRKKIKVIAMGEHDDKPRYVKAHELRYFIDDRAETCHQLEKEGICPIVFAQPWNEGRHSFKTVNSWQEIRNLCFE